MPETLRWDRCDPHLAWARVSRHRLEPHEASVAHGHDFAEWCWVESGTVLHEAERGCEHLQRGEVRLLRPGQRHRVAGMTGGGVLITMSIPGPLFAELEERYRDHPSWPWPERGIGMLQLDETRIAALDALVAGIPHSAQERCDAEWLIAGLLRALRGGCTAGATPPWLQEAVARMAEPRCLAAGLPEFIRLCGRSAAHVSREVRRIHGCTATDLVHRLRCEHAARELRLGTRSISAIAGACGYVHLGHFYRRFGAVFGCAPRAYRLAALGG